MVHVRKMYKGTVSTELRIVVMREVGRRGRRNGRKEPPDPVKLRNTTLRGPCVFSLSWEPLSPHCLVEPDPEWVTDNWC